MSHLTSRLRIPAIILLLVILAAESGLAYGADHSIRVMTYNLRYDNPGDSLDNWKYRFPSISALVEYLRPDLLGVQEGLSQMLIQLDSSFRPWSHYQRVGVGRDDGKEAGEFSAVYFDTTRFRFLASGHFWLSDTSDRPAFGWDAACIRIATWLRLEDKSTQNKLLVMNTHFDHVGVIAREQSALLIRNRIKQLQDKGDVILMGDFNSSESDRAYQSLTRPDSQLTLLDSRKIAKRPPLGPAETYCGFDPKRGIIGERIDFIFVSPRFRVLRYVTLAEQTASHRFFSDHLPVVGDLELKIK